MLSSSFSFTRIIVSDLEATVHFLSAVFSTKELQWVKYERDGGIAEAALGCSASDGHILNRA